MESLLKLSGLLGDDDDERTDLGTLERRLADKTLSHSNCGTPTKTSGRSSQSGSQPRTFDSPHTTPYMHSNRLPTPRDALASPEEQPNDNGEPVEELSDMMCSLVTNSCGGSRYIGTGCPGPRFRWEAHEYKDLPRASLSSLPKAYNGSTKRRGIPPFKT